MEELPSRKEQLGKPQSGHVSCVCQPRVCRGCDGTGLGHSPGSCGCRAGQAGTPGSSGCVRTDRPCQGSLSTPSLASCSSGGCLAALMCQAGLQQALCRIDLGSCHGIPGLSSWGCASVCLVSHLCMTRAALRLSAGPAVTKNCLCCSVAQVSFLLSLLTCNILKSSQCSLVLISSCFLFPFYRMRRSH